MMIRTCSIVCFILGSLSLTSWLQASPLRDQHLVEILSEPENNQLHQLYLHLDEQGDIQAISRISNDSQQYISADELLLDEVVLAHAEGRDAILINCQDCNMQSGGILNMKYLYNGITNSYQNFSMQIRRQQERWNLYTMDDIQIHSLTLKSRLVFGALVGIREIAINEFASSFPENIARSDLMEGSWNEILPGGDTICARGDEFKFYVYPGQSSNLIIDFVGGGACWSYETCHPDYQTFSDRITLQELEAQGLNGLYDKDHPENPLHDWTHVVIPYCTGDIHWGSQRVKYEKNGDSFYINHFGAINANTVIDWTKNNFADVDKILVTGTSAGAYGSIYWLPHIQELFPTSKVSQMGDSGVGVISQDFKERYFPNWNPTAHVATWIPELNVAFEDWHRMSLADIYKAIGNYYPDVTLSQYTTAYDDNQVFFYEVMGGSGDYQAWSETMFEMINDISNSLPNFSYFIAPGFEHCILHQKFFYELNVEGRSFVDWLWQIANGSLEDPIVCKPCRASR